MQHVNISIAGAAGVLVGVVAGAGAASLLAGEAAAPAQAIVPAAPTVVATTTVPEQPDRLVQWIKQHPSGG